jgi:hypothetical protein
MLVSIEIRHVATPPKTTTDATIKVAVLVRLPIVGAVKHSGYNVMAPVAAHAAHNCWWWLEDSWAFYNTDQDSLATLFDELQEVQSKSD